MTISTIGSRGEALFLAERLCVIAEALRRRQEPLDADASALAQVGFEIDAAGRTAGDWPHGIITQGRVFVWANSILGVTHHIEEQVGHELEATVGFLRRTAAEMKGHATGLRPTGQWAVQGEFELADDPLEHEPAAPTDDFEAADTIPFAKVDLDE